MKPILFWGSFWTTSRVPQCKCQGCYIIVPECGDPMPDRSFLSVRMSVLGVLERLPRMLVSGQVILLSLLLSSAMRVRGAILQFRGTLMVLVVRSAIKSSGHI